MSRLICVLAAGGLFLACSGPAAPTPGRPAGPTPGSAATQQPAASAGAVNTPGLATPGAPQNGGDNKSKARALIPQGATQVSEVTVGNSYSVQVSSGQSLEQLGAFWTQAIPAAGLQETGRFTSGDTLTIAFTNPEGGVTASADPSTGSVIITISAGTSQ